MSNHPTNRHKHSTNVRAFNIKRIAAKGVITLLWHLAPAFTLQRVADFFLRRPDQTSVQSKAG